MHLQDNTLFDHNLVVKVPWNVAQYSLHVTGAPAKFEMATFNGLRDAFTRKEHYLALPMTLGSRPHETLPSIYTK